MRRTGRDSTLIPVRNEKEWKKMAKSPTKNTSKVVAEQVSEARDQDVKTGSPGSATSGDKHQADQLSPADHLANLEVLARYMFKASCETFATADVDADTPQQAAAIKREAASMGKGYASLLVTTERLREIAAKADR